MNQHHFHVCSYMGTVHGVLPDTVTVAVCKTQGLWFYGIVEGKNWTMAVGKIQSCKKHNRQSFRAIVYRECILFSYYRCWNNFRKGPPWRFWILKELKRIWLGKIDEGYFKKGNWCDWSYIGGKGIYHWKKECHMKANYFIDMIF